MSKATLHHIAPGIRISVRGEDFIVNKRVPNHDSTAVLHCQGISELVKGKYFIFDTAIDTEISVLEPDHTKLVPDNESGYQKTKLYVETVLRNASFTSKKIEIAHKAAINGAAFQYTPTLKAFKLARPRILIADAVGLGKTVEAGIFMAELIKRGQGQRILVIALKSILAQFQQELWNRFAIPLMRLDSEGIAKIRAELPANKNPFDYYDKTIISIDTLKNDAKFKHYLEKSRWDIIAIDEVHTVANIDSLRGTLAQFLAKRCEAMVLTSATPHNGKKESFANIISMLEPTAIPRNGDYSKADVESYYVRRFKNDVIEDSVRDKFQERQIISLLPTLTGDEIAFLEYQQSLKFDALQTKEEKRRKRDFLFSVNLFKSFMSSPQACLKSIENRIEKIGNSPGSEDYKENNLAILEETKRLVEVVIKNKSDSKYTEFRNHLQQKGWKGKKHDDRIIIFTERIETMKFLATALSNDFDIEKGTDHADMKIIKLFDGSLSDSEQQQAVEDFGKEDSDVRVFITSDAGAAGVNLHYYCNHLYNYDIPWSIITLEQRNGRIDRFGQTKTPFIYYLLADANVKGLKTDLHIIKKLTEKENEAYQTLGDAGSVMHLYDPKKEELKVQYAISQGSEDALEEKKKDEEFDYLTLFPGEEEKTEAEIDPHPIEHYKSIYSSDLDYYTTLLKYLKVTGSVKPDDVSFGTDGLIEFVNTSEINSVLYDMPPEAKPKKNELFRLTIDKVKVEEAIANARRKKGEWAKFQMLYDLHPIIRFMMTKLEATIEKDTALVTKTTNVPAGSQFYLFHGQVANDLGQPVMSEFFVVGQDFKGKPLADGLESMKLNAFIEKFNVGETLYNQKISDEDIASLHKNLKHAVNFAKSVVMLFDMQKLQIDMKVTLSDYEAKLKKWKKESMAQMEMEFENQHTPQVLSKKMKVAKEIESILDERSQYVKNMTSLNNEPYLKLIAVFYN